MMTGRPGASARRAFRISSPSSRPRRRSRNTRSIGWSRTWSSASAPAPASSIVYSSPRNAHSVSRWARSSSTTRMVPSALPSVFSSLAMSFLQRQLDDDGRAASLAARDRDRAPVLLDDGLRNGKAEAGARRLRGEERIEQAGQDLLGDALAGVDDAHAHDRHRPRLGRPALGLAALALAGALEVGAPPSARALARPRPARRQGDLEGERAAAGHRLDGVDHQVEQDLLEQAGV